MHADLGARLVPFAGYEMPVQYPSGIISEHKHCRAAAALFDVSHMGQIELFGDTAARDLEALVCGDMQGIAPGRVRYTLFTNDLGGILDDLMVTNAGDRLYLVVNAACKAADFARLESAGLEPRMLEDRALLALQGPKAAEVLSRFAPEAAEMRFMSSALLTLDGVPCRISRSGYTGEDGYEISVPADAAENLARRLLAEDEVAPGGLGARDSLRLEAGLCLYGHDINEHTTPVEAGLTWAIQKRRRAEGGFPGDRIILAQLSSQPERRRVGFIPEGRAPLREGTALTDSNGVNLGGITSGGFGPSVGGPIAMGYALTAWTTPGLSLIASPRGKEVPVKVTTLPFVAPNYHRG